MTRKDLELIWSTIKPDDIVSRECKHATYSAHRDGEPHDMLTVKEYLTLKDGRRIPRVITVKDYKRPYWVTKPHFRDHTDKIQFEDISRVDMFKSTQINLRREMCFRLGRGNPTNPIKMLCREPYFYGIDPGPEVFLKQSYMNKWPDAFVPNKVAVIDAETDVRCSWTKPILWSLVEDDEIVLYVNKEWSYTVPNYEEAVRKEYHEVLDQWLEPIKKKLKNKDGSYPKFLDDVKNIPLRVSLFDDHFSMTKSMIDDLHEKMPDIVTGWNVFYDASVIVESCVQAGRDPADILSDPIVPNEYKMCYLRRGPREKVAASGRKVNLDPQERWDVVLNTASWRVQDAMQLYWQLRKAKGKETGGYGLDAMLTKQLGVGKVKYHTEDSAVPSGTIHWHMDMQENFKVRYGVYNLFDSIGVWALDKKNSDLSSQISSLAGSCDYSKFNSQPTINAIDMLFSVLKKRNKIICSTSDEMETELDLRLPSRDGWIVTFPSHNVVEPGLELYHDLPGIKSSIHTFNADADVETTYPTVEIILNLSKETTVAEPIKVKGIGFETLRHASINLTGGQVNSVDILESVCKMPSLDDWVSHAMKNMK